MNWFSQNWFKLSILALAIVTVAGGFYLYQKNVDSKQIVKTGNNGKIAGETINLTPTPIPINKLQDAIANEINNEPPPPPPPVQVVATKQKPNPPPVPTPVPVPVPVPTPVPQPSPTPVPIIVNPVPNPQPPPVDEARLNLAISKKTQALNYVNQDIVLIENFNKKVNDEIIYLNQISNALVGHYGEAANLLRQLTTLRRNRLIQNQALGKNLLANTKEMKSIFERALIMDFLEVDLSTLQKNIYDTNTLDASFEQDKSQYDDNVRMYLNILGISI